MTYHTAAQVVISIYCAHEMAGSSVLMIDEIVSCHAAEVGDVMWYWVGGLRLAIPEGRLASPADGLCEEFGHELSVGLPLAGAGATEAVKGSGERDERAYPLPLFRLAPVDRGVAFLQAAEH